MHIWECISLTLLRVRTLLSRLSHNRRRQVTRPELRGLIGDSGRGCKAARLRAASEAMTMIKAAKQTPWTVRPCLEADSRPTRATQLPDTSHFVVQCSPSRTHARDRRSDGCCYITFAGACSSSHALKVLLTRLCPSLSPSAGLSRPACNFALSSRPPTSTACCERQHRPP